MYEATKLRQGDLGERTNDVYQIRGVQVVEWGESERFGRLLSYQGKPNFIARCLGNDMSDLG